MYTKQQAESPVYAKDLPQHFIAERELEPSLKRWLQFFHYALVLLRYQKLYQICEGTTHVHHVYVTEQDAVVLDQWLS